MTDHRPLVGIVMMCAAVTFNATKDGLAKILVAGYEPLFLLWVQSVVTVLVFLPFIVARHGWSVVIPRPLGLQFLRGVTIIIGVGGFYTSVQYIPLADATAMIFAAPLVVTTLSPLILGETVGFKRWAAVIVGFIGVIIILRPDFSGDRIGYFIALGAGTGLGFFYMLNRNLSQYSAPFVAVAYTSLTAAILLTPVGPFKASPPKADDAAIIILFFVLAIIGQALMVSSFRFAPAATIAPFQYVQLIVATIFGWLVFQAFPDQLTWVGVALVVAAGLFIAYREGRGHKDAEALK
ncbi:MAG: DMT family transporter [Rhodospirillales bacterium]|nr:DMT family transporter [Rhodospirillales bacterium]